ncbi:MAG: hypothetical protein J6575_03585 [Bifidobacterium sp.]|nr:hypothetical protein [Bifidobacterium sp.]
MERLIVEELILATRYPNNPVVKVDGKWYLKDLHSPKLISELKMDVDALHKADPKNWPYSTHNSDFLTYGCRPKQGWKPTTLKRAATPEELQQIAQKYHGTIEGERRLTYWPGLKGAETSFVVTTLHIDSGNPVVIEDGIRSMGIEAINGTPSTVDIRIK